MRKGGREGWRVKKGGKREEASEGWGRREGGSEGRREGRREVVKEDGNPSEAG